jgi:peptidoglycan hydrolase-like protein with peptidoglycan-binding domain
MHRCRRFADNDERNRPMRALLLTLVLASAGTLALDLEPAAAPPLAKPVEERTLAAASRQRAPETVQVAFVRNGRLVRAERVLPPAAQPALHALRELAQGPTKAERRSGLKTALRPGLKPRFVHGAGELLLVRVAGSLTAPAAPRTMGIRLAQISATLSWLGTPRRYAAISANGRLVTTLRLGVRPGVQRLVDGEQGYRFSMRGVQVRLWLIGFLHRGDVTGSLDYRTAQALLAFQGWHGLSRTGTVTGETQLALFRAREPRPATRGPGRRIEIHRGPGVLLVVEDGEVVRAIHTSTGVGGITPAGDFRVYRKERYSWSVPFQVWMPWAAYFRGGIATHEYPDVPAYPASHGCVRLPEGEAERVYDFVEVGTPVRVF